MEDLFSQIPVTWIIEIVPMDHDKSIWSVTIMKPSGVEVSQSIGFDLRKTLSHAIAIVKDKSEFR